MTTQTFDFLAAEQSAALARSAGLWARGRHGLARYEHSRARQYGALLRDADAARTAARTAAEAQAAANESRLGAWVCMLAAGWSVAVMAAASMVG